eukprot:4917551-Prymnesium_polylepis.1
MQLRRAVPVFVRGLAVRRRARLLRSEQRVAPIGRDGALLEEDLLLDGCHAVDRLPLPWERACVQEGKAVPAESGNESPGYRPHAQRAARRWAASAGDEWAGALVKRAAARRGPGNAEGRGGRAPQGLDIVDGRGGPPLELCEGGKQRRRATRGELAALDERFLFAARARDLWQHPRRPPIGGELEGERELRKLLGLGRALLGGRGRERGLQEGTAGSVDSSSVELRGGRV